MWCLDQFRIGEPSHLGLDQAVNTRVGHVHQCRIVPGIERECLALGQPLRERGRSPYRTLARQSPENSPSCTQPGADAAVPALGTLWGYRPQQPAIDSLKGLGYLQWEDYLQGLADYLPSPLNDNSRLTDSLELRFPISRRTVERPLPCVAPIGRHGLWAPPLVKLVTGLMITGQKCAHE